MFSRRILLASAAVAALGGCATFSSNFARAVGDLRIIANGLRGALGNLANLNIVPAGTAAQIAVWIDSIDRLATDAAGALTESGAKDTVKQIEVLLNSIITSLASFPLPPAITTALTAASILLPVVGSLLNMIIRPAPALSAPRGGYGVGNSDEARAYLRAVAAKK